jgi:hypothetical protein
MGITNPALLIFQALKLVENRRFNPEWFDEFGSWLEYSESSDRAYCFPCFLMRGRSKKEAGYEAFVVDGWNSWNNPSRLIMLEASEALIMKLKKIVMLC